MSEQQETVAPEQQVAPSVTVNDMVNIKANTAISSIEIYDVQGRIVHKKITNQKTESIDVAAYSNGIYFLKIKTELGEKVEKIVKK